MTKLCAQRTQIRLGIRPVWSVFTVLSHTMSTQRRLWSDWADAQADLSLRWMHVIMLVLSWGSSFGFCFIKTTIRKQFLWYRSSMYMSHICLPVPRALFQKADCANLIHNTIICGVKLISLITNYFPVVVCFWFFCLLESNLEEIVFLECQTSHHFHLSLRGRSIYAQAKNNLDLKLVFFGKRNNFSLNFWPAPVAQSVECPIQGTGVHGFNPGLRHTKVVIKGTSCSLLGTQTYVVITIKIIIIDFISRGWHI